MRPVLYRLGILVLAGLLLGSVRSAEADVDPQERLKKHVRDIVQKVKRAPTAAKKRAILDEELRELIGALDRAREMADLSQSDEAAIGSLRDRLQEKLDELRGQAGYEQVPPGQLDAFADYVQQDFEQADTVTISVTAALLILILVVLLA